MKRVNMVSRIKFVNVEKGGVERKGIRVYG